MIKIAILLALLISGCASKGYYVQEKLTLAKVSVRECAIVTYRNVDTDKVTSRRQCRNLDMDAIQRSAWERLRDNTNGSKVDGSGFDDDEDFE